MTCRQSDAVTFPSSQNSQVHLGSLRDIRRTLILIGLLAAVTSLAYFLRFHDFSTPDSFSYLDPARNLASGNGFKDAQGYPETFRTPGYPLLIVPFFRFGLDLKYLIVLQHLFRIAIVLSATLLAFKLTNSRRHALIAGILICLDLPTLEAANTIMSETLFTAVLLTAFWLLWKSSENSQRNWKTSALAGLATGASVLVRPVAMLFVGPAVLYLFLIRKTFRWSAAWSFVIAFSCLPLFWATRNYQQTNRFTVSSVSGVDILLWRAAAVLARHDPGGLDANFEKRQRQLQAQACDEIKRLSGKNCSSLSATERSDYYLHFGSKILLQHKSDYMFIAFQGAGRTLLGSDATRFSQMFQVSYKTAAGILLIYTIPCLCLVVIGFPRVYRANRAFFFLALLFILYFVAISAGPEGYSRFRVPIMPVYAVLAASGLDAIVRRFSKVLETAE